MNVAARSLRLQVEKWLVPTLSTPVRVTRFSRTRSNQRRYVRVEILRPAGAVGLFFSGTTTAHGVCSRLRPDAWRCARRHELSGSGDCTTCIRVVVLEASIDVSTCASIASF